MSQYEVAKFLYESDHPKSKEEIAREVGVMPATVGDTLRTLRNKKGLAKQVGKNQFAFHPEATEEDLERIKPMTITYGDR